MKTKTSRLSGFYKKSLGERLAILAEWADLTAEEADAIKGTLGLSLDQASHMIENTVGMYSLPMGIGTNFFINNKEYLVPMVVEEPSVVAAVSNAAKMFRSGGGFISHSDKPLMIGQIQVLDIPNPQQAQQDILAHKQKLLLEADKVGGSIVKRGGGARDIEVRMFENTLIGHMLVVHLIFDTREAMGANAINTAAEHLAPFIEEITGGRVNLRILSNLTDKRKAYAEGIIPANMLARDDISGEEAVDAIVEAGIFAEVDPYRATTHNKGVMNGIDAVVLATGNDWRAVEAGAHAYAARRGRYASLTKWWKDEDGNLRGSIELPLAVGTVGGATRVHPAAGVALKILGNPSSRELSEVMACVGLAQNLGAIRALATEGIQHGHMRMHARQLAVAAGASSDTVTSIAQQLIDEDNIRLQRAEEIVAERNTQNSGGA
ncbi:MAG: hydroxymethylglutaryl-CoA reductase, degradative [Chloroflexota bacterium]